MSELILGPIVGGLSSSQAYLWGRADGPATLHAWVGQQPNLSDAQLLATSLPLTSETGFAGVAPLHDLDPDTRYHYALTLSNTPPVAREKDYPAFITFPPEREPASFAFAFGSCFRPEGDDGGQIFRDLEKQRQKDDLRFILLIGDQIYADAYDKNGIRKIACNLEEYREVYKYTWQRPAFKDLLPNLPAFMTLDDHEVDDDWRWTNGERTWACIPLWDQVIRFFQRRPTPERRIPLKRVQDALQAYWEHQGMHAPNFQLPPLLDTQGRYSLAPDDPGSLAYTFTYGAAAFFVLDTRTMRVKNRREKTMLGQGQWAALESWLLAVKDAYPVKFLVSSASLLYDLWIDLARDRWSGFPTERERLLNFLADNAITGVYILAGDLHSAHAIYTELKGPAGHPISLWEFCSTPFEQAPNTLSSRTYQRVRSKVLVHQEPVFKVGELNFGVVKVDFPPQRKPRVLFEVYGKGGEHLAAAGD